VPSGRTVPTHNDTAVVTFSTPVDVKTAIHWIRSRGLTGVELTARYTNGDENLNTHYEFPRVAPSSSATTPAIVSDYGTSISNLLADLHDDAVQADSESTAAEISHLESVQQDFASGARPISEALVTGPTNVLRAARSDPLVSSVGIKSEAQAEQSHMAGEPKSSRR
jgi:hypothetical protein